MKKSLFIFIFLFISLASFTQVTPIPTGRDNTLTIYAGGVSAKMLGIPPTCGKPSPSLFTAYKTANRIAYEMYDTCNKVLYMYNPSSNTVDTVGMSGTFTDNFVTKDTSLVVDKVLTITIPHGLGHVPSSIVSIDVDNPNARNFEISYDDINVYLNYNISISGTLFVHIVLKP